MVACIVTGIILSKRATGFKYGESSMCVFQNVSKHLVCEKKKGLQSVNMKFSGPVLIEIKVMQTLFRLFWCTLLKTRLSSIFLWHSPFLTQKGKVAMFFVLVLGRITHCIERLHHFLTILSVSTFKSCCRSSKERSAPFYIILTGNGNWVESVWPPLSSS